MYRSFKRLISSRFPALFHRKFPKKILYKGFSNKSVEDFNKFTDSRFKNPAKKQALDWLANDNLLNEKFSLLDLGCGPGVIPLMILRDSDLSGRVAYTGVDVSENAISYCRRKLPKEYVTLCRDFLKEGLPAGRFDVIMINEVIEHLPFYDKLIPSAIEKEPKLLILTTFAVLHNQKRDRILWHSEAQCYMNSYSFEKFFQFLRNKVACPILICDLDRQIYNRFWFPRKELVLWYMRLTSPSIGFLDKK